jgi:beta-glucosidase
VSPSGKLVDTITKNGYSDYPSYGNFGDPTTTNHVEDIYVGYRYFETFAIDKVMYHFGYGLSYTKFKLEQIGGLEIKNGRINLSVKVTNIGNRYGKEVVQVYFQPPQSGLNKPDHQLVAYVKTDTLGPNNSQMINISFDVNEMASYNDAPNENR